MLEKKLKLYRTSANNLNIKERFPTTAEGELPLEIGEFTYDAKRMGGAPTIQCTIMYQRCLDDEWTDYVYTEFRGERYYLKQTPSSSKDNKSAMWKHECEFISERRVLDNVYFFDIVKEDEGGNKPVSNSTDFTFFGNIFEFATRLTESMNYAGVGYKVNAEKHRTELTDATVGKQVSFQDKFISEALQEIFNVYGYHYYFEGKTIYIGDSDDYKIGSDENPLEYGGTKQLLSIQKNNANYKPINKITSRGSDQNIPYYYPNPSSKGEVRLTKDEYNPNTKVEIIDEVRFYNRIGEWDTITITSQQASKYNEVTRGTLKATANNDIYGIEFTEKYNEGDYNKYKYGCRLRTNFGDDGKLTFNLVFEKSFILSNGTYTIYPIKKSYYDVEVRATETTHYGITHKSERNMAVYPTSYELFKDGEKITYPYNATLSKDTTFAIKETFSFRIDQKGYTDFVYDLVLKLNEGALMLGMDKSPLFTVNVGNKTYPPTESFNDILKEYSLIVSDDRPSKEHGLTIGQEIIKYIKPYKNLMPKVYINSESKERFYLAKNYPIAVDDDYVANTNTGEEIKDGYLINNNYIKNEETGEYYEFENPYVSNNPYEHIIDFEDIMPTIEGVENEDELRIDMFSEFAYDDGDNNKETEDRKDNKDESGELRREHPYFFGKLRKMPFNLFDHAIEGGEMTIAMTSGSLGSCKFVIHVGEEHQKNIVQVYTQEDADNGECNEEDIGTLKRDNYGNVVCGRRIYVEGKGWEGQGEQTPQDVQNDTRTNEVWVALAKDVETFPSVMPYAKDGGLSEYRPSEASPNENNGDTFVILNIKLPQAYIDKAEERLTKETIKYLAENNSEKFTFSIDFSKVYLAMNPNILNSLNENSSVYIKYNDKVYKQFISSYSYKMSSKDALPEIKVNLSETLSAQTGALQQVINAVKSEVQYSIGASGGSGFRLGDLDRQYIRKDTQDKATGNITFLNGTKYGKNKEDGEASAEMLIDDENNSTLTVDNLIVRNNDERVQELIERIVSLENKINELTNN